MSRLLLGSICFAVLGFCSCQQQEQTEVDILQFPDEVRTVVSAPGYEKWYHEDRSAAQTPSATKDVWNDPQSADDEGPEGDWEDQAALSEDLGGRDAAAAYPPSSIGISLGDQAR